MAKCTPLGTKTKFALPQRELYTIKKAIVTLSAGQSRTILKTFGRNAIRPSSRGAARATGEKKRGNKLHQSYKPLSPVCALVIMQSLLCKFKTFREGSFNTHVTTLCGMGMNMGYELRAMEKNVGDLMLTCRFCGPKFRLTCTLLTVKIANQPQCNVFGRTKVHHL